MTPDVSVSGASAVTWATAAAASTSPASTSPAGTLTPGCFSFAAHVRGVVGGGKNRSHVSRFGGASRHAQMTTDHEKQNFG